MNEFETGRYTHLQTTAVKEQMTKILYEDKNMQIETTQQNE